MCSHTSKSKETDPCTCLFTRLVDTCVQKFNPSKQSVHCGHIVLINFICSSELYLEAYSALSSCLKSLQNNSVLQGCLVSTLGICLSEFYCIDVPYP